MMENLALILIFIVIDIIFCIKKVPIMGWIFGVIQLTIVFAVFLPDTNLNILFPLICGIMAVLMIFINVLDFVKE